MVAASVLFVFFFLPREGAAALRGTRLGLGFFYFCFPPQNFSAPPPLNFTVD